MKNNLRAIVLFFFIWGMSLLASGQDIQKEKDKANGESFTYYCMQPKVAVRGILVLLPAFGEKPLDIFGKTKLPENLAEKGYLTITPDINRTLFADEFTKAALDRIIKTQSEKYKVFEVIIGGLSSGGAVAAGYAEYVLAKDMATILKGVIVIDAPLDLQRIYASAERKIKYGCQGLIAKEGHTMKNGLDHTLGGPPDVQPAQYLKFSAYSARAADGGNAKYLKNIPVRLYSEPDLDFVKKTYCNDLQFDDINAFDLQGLNQFLLKIGNNRCQYITTQGKGFHSWNIIEPIDCTNWIISNSN